MRLRASGNRWVDLRFLARSLVVHVTAIAPKQRGEMGAEQRRQHVPVEIAPVQ